MPEPTPRQPERPTTCVEDHKINWLTDSIAQCSEFPHTVWMWKDGKMRAAHPVEIIDALAAARAEIAMLRRKYEEELARIRKSRDENAVEWWNALGKVEADRDRLARELETMRTALNHALDGFGSALDALDNEGAASDEQRAEWQRIEAMGMSALGLHPAPTPDAGSEE